MANKPVKRIKLDSKGNKSIDTTPAGNVKKKNTTNTPASGATKAKQSGKSALKNAAKPAMSIGQYFKGSWDELRQVRWPNRRATWSLTAAVLIYSAFFTVLILLLDAGFQLLFKEVILK
jgi:preprotein translocase subunit SecE